MVVCGSSLWYFLIYSLTIFAFCDLKDLAFRRVKLHIPHILPLFQGGTSFVDLLCFYWLVVAMPLRVSVYMCLVVTCWERVDLLALVLVSNFEFVTFPLVSWVRCGT